MEFDRILSDNEVAPVTMTRLMGAMTDLGIRYRVDEEDDCELWASWPGYIVHVVWDGPFEPTLLFGVRIWGDMHIRQLPELTAWVAAYNSERCQPTLGFRKQGERLTVHVDAFVSLKGGMSDAQLRENLDTIFGGINRAARAVGMEFPELTHTEPGFLANFDADELDLTLPVTNGRIEKTLEILEAEDIFEHPSGDVTFRSNDVYHCCRILDGGTWLQVATTIGETTHLNGLLFDLANELNIEEQSSRFCVLPDGDGHQLRCESNTFISIGMTAAQLGEALRDAVWGHNHLHWRCLQRLQAMEKTASN